MATVQNQKPELPRTISRTVSMNEAIFVYKNNDAHSQRMIKAIEANWENEEYCDLELVVGIQEKKVLAHKIILVSACEYFSALLRPRMKEGNQTSVRCLEHLQSEAVEKLIKYCYSGNINLKVSSEISIEHLLEASDYMRFQEVCQEIGKFLESHLSVDNCLGFLQCADHFSLNTLRSSALMYASFHYFDITKVEEFLMLPPPFLEELLKNENLIIQKSNIALSPNMAEQSIVESVIEYVRYDQGDSRKTLLPHLLMCVKLPLLTKDQLDILLNNVIIKDNKECKMVIEKAKRVDPVKVTDEVEDNWARPRKSQGLLLREFRQYAGHGQIQPEKEKFNCRDILTADSFVFVKGLKVGIRRWDGRKVVGGMQVFYSNGQKPTYGMEMDQCQSQYEVTLKPNERISKIDISAGWLIDMLHFHTNLGNEFGPFGGEGGSKYVEVPPQSSCAYLAGISGVIAFNQESLCITKLKFMWGFYDFSFSRNSIQDKLLNTSKLYIFNGNNIDIGSNLHIKNGDIVYSLSDIEDIRRTSLVTIKVTHCHSGIQVEVNPWSLTPYYSDEPSFQYQFQYDHNFEEASYSEEEFNSDIEDDYGLA